MLHVSSCTNIKLCGVRFNECLLRIGLKNPKNMDENKIILTKITC